MTVSNRHDFLQAGDFNLRCSLEELQETPDGYGGFDQNWTLKFDVWVKLIPLSAALIRMAENERLKLTHYIYTRKRDGIDQGMRFVKGNRRFLIRTVQDPDESGRYLVCQVSEGE